MSNNMLPMKSTCIHVCRHVLNDLRFRSRAVHEKRDVIYGELAEYLQLKTVIENIKVSFLFICLIKISTMQIYLLRKDKCELDLYACVTVDSLTKFIEKVRTYGKQK